MTTKGIRQRGKTWLVDVTKRGRRMTATCATLVEAEAKRAEMLSALLNGDGAGRAVGTKQKDWSLGQAFEHTLEHVWAGTRAERTARVNAETALEHFGRSKPLVEITHMALLDWIKAMRAARKSDGTINRKLAALSKIMSEAVKAGGLPAKPPFPRLREPQGRIRYLNAEEEHALLALLAQHTKTLEREMVVVLLDTGLRVSELLALEARDVDPKANLLTIWHNKTDLPRSIKMTARVQEAILTRLALVKALDDKRLYPVSYDSLHFVFMRACAILGLDDVVIHTLRHTCCTRLVQRGIDLKTVMAWMGHKSIMTTMRYLGRRDSAGSIDALPKVATAVNRR